MEGFAKLPRSVLLATDLSIPAKVLYGVLKDYDWRNRPPTQADMAQHLGKSVRSVRIYLGELRRAGWITIDRRGVSQPNNYTIIAGSDRQPIAGSDRQPIAGSDRQPIAGSIHIEQEIKKERALGGSLSLSSDFSDHSPLTSHHSLGTDELLARWEACDVVMSSDPRSADCPAWFIPAAIKHIDRFLNWKPAMQVMVREWWLIFRKQKVTEPEFEEASLWLLSQTNQPKGRQQHPGMLLGRIRQVRSQGSGVRGQESGVRSQATGTIKPGNWRDVAERDEFGNWKPRPPPKS